MENLDFEVSDPADPNKVADANIFHFHIKFPTFSSNFYFWVKAVKAFFREKSGGSKLSLHKKHPVQRRPPGPRRHASHHRETRREQGQRR